VGAGSPHPTWEATGTHRHPLAGRTRPTRWTRTSGVACVVLVSDDLLSTAPPPPGRCPCPCAVAWSIDWALARGLITATTSMESSFYTDRPPPLARRMCPVPGCSLAPIHRQTTSPLVLYMIMSVECKAPGKISPPITIRIHHVSFLAVFRSQIWSAKIHGSISFVFGNNCPTMN
jgi:hypothetical protein